MVYLMPKEMFSWMSTDLYEVERQTSWLGEIARKRGSAIGIGHVGRMGRNTPEALRQMIPQLEQQGFHFVFVSDLVY